MTTNGPRIAVLLSGSGTSLENLLARIDAGEVPGRVVVVVASRESAFGLTRARNHGEPDLVCLLGFLSPFETRGRYDRRTLNVHPALIPAFSGKGYYGHRVHDAVLEAGVKVTGATVHFVDGEYDHGPIVLQEAVPVRDDDTAESLAERVQEAERRLVPEAVRLFAAGRLQIDGRRVRMRDEAPPG